MFFATPIWLLALVPWAALAVWMLWGRRERVGVPFLALWRGGDVRPSASRAVRAPPLTIILLLLAVLLAIVAASSPIVSAPGAAPVTVILDRGITMSARDGGAYRYQRVGRLLADMLAPGGTVIAQAVPGIEQTTDRQGFASLLDSLPPTALDTAIDVKQATIRALHAPGGHIVVVTDQPIDLDDPRLVVAMPQSPMPPNVGIAHVAARERPVSQVMVRLHADAPAKVNVVITSDGQRVERTIDAPGTAFIDVPRLGKTVEAALAQGDALTADDRAWLVRETGWPRIEPIATLPAELARMVKTYRKLRSARDDSRAVLIVDDARDAVGEAVILAPATTPASGVPQVTDHPVTANVNWTTALAAARLAEAVPAELTPLVSMGNRVALAARENPRQVWVAMDAPALARTADYVVFWTNVFDWLGQSGEALVAHPIGLLGAEWRRVTDGPPGTEPGLWPGLYERGDGTLRAVNVGPRATPAVPAVIHDWQEQLVRMAPASAGGRALAPYLVLLALVCALIAAVRWPAHKAAQT